ncbi:MAG: ArnT family glycosyltransferase, partial [Nitrospiraceae bacterium]
MSSLFQMFAELGQRQRYVLLTLLFLASVIALSPGIGEVTGVTAKDEYFVYLRTALSMIEQDAWIVPILDGAPFVKKPPMISWLTRASFEVFGVSLTSARMVSVLFAALFVLVVALIGFEFTENLRYSLCAGLIALSTAGVAIQSKYLLFDVPTATFGGFGFYWFLKWCKRDGITFLVGVTICLSGGFLTKGPIVFVVFGSGVLALLIVNREVRSVVLRRNRALIGSLLLFLGLTVPWFLYVYMLYPDYSVAMIQHDIAARQFGNFTLIPLIGPAIIAFPWTFLLIHLLIQPNALPTNLLEVEGRRTMLILWLGLSILPFLFIKTFIRYLIGSIIPIALLCAAMIESNAQRPIKIHARVGMIVTSFVVLLFAGFCWWFKTPTGGLAAVLVGYAVFTMIWWQGTRLFLMALSATVLWMMLLGFLYPSLGVNEIPPRIFKEVEGRPVILYRGPQPGLLPITMGRSLKQRLVLTTDDVSNKGGPSPLIFAPEEDAKALERELRTLGVGYERVDSYKTLSSRVWWIRFAREGATWKDWIHAMRSRTLEPIKRTIVLYAILD